MSIKRGDIYYVMPKGGGHGDSDGRPAIVVGNMELFGDTGIVPVVYIVQKPNDDKPGHIVVRVTGKPSIALCEQAWNIPVERFGNFAGACSAAEMTQIDIALSSVLGLDGLFGGNIPAVPDSAAEPARDEELERLNERVEELDRENDALATDLQRIDNENTDLSERCNKLSLDLIRMTERADIYESQFKELMRQVMGGKGEHDGT